MLLIENKLETEKTTDLCYRIGVLLYLRDTLLYTHPDARRTTTVRQKLQV